MTLKVKLEKANQEIWDLKQKLFDCNCRVGDFVDTAAEIVWRFDKEGLGSLDQELLEEFSKVYNNYTHLE